MHVDDNKQTKQESEQQEDSAGETQPNSWGEALDDLQKQELSKTEAIMLKMIVELRQTVTLLWEDVKNLHFDVPEVDNKMQRVMELNGEKLKAQLKGDTARVAKVDEEIAKLKF